MKLNFFKRRDDAISHGAPGWVQQQASAARFAAQLKPSAPVNASANVKVGDDDTRRTSSCWAPGFR